LHDPGPRPSAGVPAGRAIRGSGAGADAAPGDPAGSLVRDPGSPPGRRPPPAADRPRPSTLQSVRFHPAEGAAVPSRPGNDGLSSPRPVTHELGPSSGFPG